MQRRVLWVGLYQVVHFSLSRLGRKGPHRSGCANLPNLNNSLFSQVNLLTFTTPVEGWAGNSDGNKC